MVEDSLYGKYNSFLDLSQDVALEPRAKREKSEMTFTCSSVLASRKKLFHMLYNVVYEPQCS